MSDVIIAAIITALGSIVAAFVGNSAIRKRKKKSSQRSEHESVIIQKAKGHRNTQHVKQSEKENVMIKQISDGNSNKQFFD